MECAERLFAQNGYAETSIRDIAREASMNSAMISYYFGSKEKLVKAILDYRTTDLGKVFPAMVSTEKSSLDRMLTLVDFYIDKVFEQKDFYKLLYQLQASDKESSLMEYFNQQRHRNHNLLTALFTEGATTGEFNPDIDISMLTSTLTGTINHIVFNQNYYREVNNMQKMAESKFIILIKERSKKHLGKLISIMVK